MKTFYMIVSENVGGKFDIIEDAIKETERLLNITSMQNNELFILECRCIRKSTRTVDISHDIYDCEISDTGIAFKLGLI